MKTKYALVLLTLLSGGARGGEIDLKTPAIHPEWRSEPGPNRQVALVNPPALILPSERVDWRAPFLSYDFEVSRSRSFDSVAFRGNDRKASMFVPDETMENGIWYWRVRGDDEAWRGPFTFEINDAVWKNQAPPAERFVDGVTEARPRVLARAARLSTLREELKDSEMVAYFLKNAEKYVGVELPEQEWSGRFFKDGKRVFQNKKFPPEHRKAQPTGRVFAEASHALSLAYIVGGDEIHGREAVRWASRVATFDLEPTLISEDLYAYQDAFDYAALMSALVYAYDSCHALMTDDERAAIRDALIARADSYFRYFVNRLECRVMDNHAWQHTFLQFLEAAVALKGDTPAADEQLAYCYEVWRARQPVQSTFDGGWHNGKYYMVNAGTWIGVPVMFAKFTGHDFYAHPWYANQPKWMLYKRPPGSQGDGFGGDGYETSARGIEGKEGAWLKVLDAELDLPLARWLASTAEKEPASKRWSMLWSRISEGLPLASDRPVEPPTRVEQAAVFRDTGIVNMNRDVLNSAENLMVSLRSGPWGGFGHNLSSHNAFTVLSGGEPLFVPFRFRHGGKQHAFKCYRHTRGHNSVLVNGKGQPISSEAYGWIPRFLSGDSITYAVGDASNAYAGKPSPQWLDRVTEAGIEWADEFGEPRLSRFRRHLLFLRPSTIVIYDELEATEPVRWDWMLHCRENMRAEPNALLVESPGARVDFFGPDAFDLEVREEALVPPFNVDGRGGNPPAVYKSVGAHAYVTPRGKSAETRVLAVIQVDEDPRKPARAEDGSIVCGDWIIRAELDPSREANLQVRGTGGVAFEARDERGRSVLTDWVNGRLSERTAVDEAPLAARRFEGK